MWRRDWLKGASDRPTSSHGRSGDEHIKPPHVKPTSNSDRKCNAKRTLPGCDDSMTWTFALGWFFAIYALLTGIFIVQENRRPETTLA